MINIRTIRKLNNNDGLTLKYGKIKTYKSGWQVATSGVECHTAEEAIKAVRNFGGNCGIWLEVKDGVSTYYIDNSQRVATKKEAIEIGRTYNQISIFKWDGAKLYFL